MARRLSLGFKLQSINRDSSVSTETRLRAGRRSIRLSILDRRQKFLLLHRILTDSGTNPASCSGNIGSILAKLKLPVVMLTVHLSVIPTLRTSGVMPSIPHTVLPLVKWRDIWHTFHFSISHIFFGLAKSNIKTQ